MSNVRHHVSKVAHLVPRHRADFDRLDQLLKLQPSEVDSCLGSLMTWLQDINYPVALPIAEYLVNRGGVVVPHVAEVLRTGDHWWKHCVLTSVVDRWPKDLVEQIQPELERLAVGGIADSEEVDIRALHLLVKHQLGNRADHARLLQFKLVGARGLLEELTAIETLMKRDG
jgi:Domain of unknown function (DUF5071)